MKTAIIYVSSHHGNTKKVIDEMATVKEIDLFKISQAKATDFSNYDAIGFASGVYYHCRGYDTFGFFEKIGGIAKGHPNEKDFKKAREFIKNI